MLYLLSSLIMASNHRLSHYIVFLILLSQALWHTCFQFLALQSELWNLLAMEPLSIFSWKTSYSFPICCHAHAHTPVVIGVCTCEQTESWEGVQMLQVNTVFISPCLAQLRHQRSLHKSAQSHNVILNRNVSRDTHPGGCFKKKKKGTAG